MDKTRVSIRFFKYTVFILLFMLAGCAGQKKQDDEVLASFDGAQITKKEFLRKLESMPREIRAVAFQKKQEFLEDMASEHFLLKEAERKGLQKDSDVKDLIDVARRKIIVAKLVENEVDKKVSVAPDEALKYYEANPSEFMTPQLLRGSHILVKTEEEANQIKAQLDAGADFEEIARAQSLDATAKRGGDLGFFQKGQFVPEFEEKAFQMKKGEISGPVKSQFGYHIIKITDSAAPSVREFKSVKNLVEEKLFNEKRSKAFKAMVAQIKGNRKIDINEKALESLKP